VDQGRLWVPIEIDGAILGMLLRLRWLAERDERDHRAIKAAIEHMLEDTARSDRYR